MTTVQIDRAGRLVLPKRVRERFRLRGGEMLAIEVKEDAIELRPTQAVGELKKVNGLLVYTIPGTLADEDFAGQSRDERMDYVMGGVKDK